MVVSHLFISLTTTLLFLIISYSPTTKADPPQDIFLLAGQSNMAGRGGIRHHSWDGFVPPESQPRANILRLDIKDTWVEAHEPLHVDIDVGQGKTCGVGPGMAFANGLRSLGAWYVLRVIGLVPCAVGGTRIDQWAKGGEMYGQLVRRAKVATQGGGKIRGVLWYQGESDTVRVEDSNAYKGKLEKFIGDLRVDLGDPSLLFIQVALASGEGKYMETVRQAQLSTKLPNVKCVDAKGLRLEGDHLHLTTMSQVRVGLMLARAFLHISHSHNGSHLNSNSFIET